MSMSAKKVFQSANSAQSIKLNGYHPLVYTLCRNNVQGGGIGIYVKSKFSFTVIPEHSVFIDCILKTIVIEITVNPSSKIYIASMYRPGSNHAPYTVPC